MNAPTPATAIYDADGALVDYGGGEPEWAEHYRSHPGQPEETITGAVVQVDQEPQS